MTHVPMNEPAAPEEVLGGATPITHDPIERYAVFVQQADAEAFSQEHVGWRVDWCVSAQESGQVV